MSGGVIFSRFKGDEKKLQALSKVVGRKVSYLSAYVFTMELTGYKRLKFYFDFATGTSISISMRFLVKPNFS
jgi:hypothetical protein